MIIKSATNKVKGLKPTRKMVTYWRDKAVWRAAHLSESQAIPRLGWFDHLTTPEIRLQEALHRAELAAAAANEVVKWQRALSR